MRIAFFSEVFLPKVDGIVNTLCRLLDHLERNGDTCIIVAPSGSVPHYGNASVLCVPSLPAPIYPELKLAFPWYNLDKELDAFQPDLVHVLNPFTLGLVGLRYARQRSLPLVASYHTDIPGFAQRWGLGAFSGGLWSYLRWIHNQADLNYCPSRATLTDLSRQGFERVRVWSRGVDTQRFSPAFSDPIMRLRLSGGQPCERLLIYVGRLSAEKRIHWLREVLLASPGTHLAIVGDGPQRNELEQTFQNLPVTFTGYLRGADLASAYASSDLFVFPAANETFGNVALEAMASGLPVVAPRSGGLLDFVEDGQHGLLFDPEDRMDLLRQTNKIIQNPDLAQSLGSAGRRAAEQRGWNQILENLRDQYGSLVRREHTLPVRKAPSSLRRIPGINPTSFGG
jgi:phosphatidylinositol alpha 1,6-mannosyltransferase